MLKSLHTIVSFGLNYSNHIFVSSWVGFVSKNYEIERACVELEQEIYEMQKQGAR